MRQARFRIVWKTANREEEFFADSKVVATAHLSAIIMVSHQHGMHPYVEERSEMVPEQRPDGTQDSWNRVRVRTYVVREDNA